MHKDADFILVAQSMKNDNLRGQRSQLISNDETVNARLCNRCCLLIHICNIPLDVLD